MVCRAPCLGTGSATVVWRIICVFRSNAELLLLPLLVAGAMAGAGR
eukprot:COSAG01_NODE_37303_length_505_cov_1.017241_1_plen_45_part_10